MFFGVDLINLVTTVGYVGLFILIFSESGLFIGLLLPGDSVLFTAGFLASQGYLNISILCLLMFLAAVSGDSFGYYFGKIVGYRIFNREKSLLFSKDHIQRAEKFFDKYGAKTIIIARFT
ncbi:MAG: DedA family protein, partial [Candidatus Yanofskybacteria bacterium]|nr:DedA family protein [Candidatus Yanofskybacteria bacterium]